MKVVVISHYTQNPGTTHHLIRYLKEKAYAFLVLLLPLNSTLPYRIIKMTRDKKEEFSYYNLRKLNYLLGPVFSLVTLFRENYDLFIGVDPFNALVGWILKKFLCKRCLIIFYSVDYSPRRFSNVLLNKLYHLFDNFAVRVSDFIWCSSKRIFRIRKTQKTIEKRVLYVPNGSWMKAENVQKREPQKIDVIEFVFAGYLGEQYDLDIFIREVNEKKNFKFHIFGDGPRKKELQKISGSNIIFHGTIPNEALLMIFKTKNWIGVAPYNNRVSHTLYGSSLKVIEYLSCGLPVIVSTVVEIADEIKKNRCGWIYSNIAQLRSILKEIEASISREYNKLSKNALEYSKNFYWGKIYDQAFFDTFRLLRQKNSREQT